MKAYMEKQMKELIEEYPALNDLLAEYDIGCGPCSVGICLLKDIVSIHQMSPEKEEELMSRIAEVINSSDNNS